jgi:CBS domain-containing membrane protein
MKNRLFQYVYDNFYDKEFKQHKLQYVLQCTLAIIAIFAALMTLNLVYSDLVIASIASTTFVVFTMPHKVRSKSRYVIGGYFIGFIVGMLSYLLAHFFMGYFPIIQNYYDELFGAIAVGGSIFFMVIFNLEHPPASAVSLAMVINHWNRWTIFVTVVSLIFVLGLRYILRNKLINLL